MNFTIALMGSRESLAQTEMKAINQIIVFNAPTLS